MPHRVRVLVVGGVGALALAYCIQFGVWWYASPRATRILAARPVTRVEFHYTPFYWHTAIAWVPARFFVEHVLGYRSVALAAAGSDSIEIYERP